MPAGALKHKLKPLPQRDQDSLRAGRLIADRYRIERQIGTSGVWLARADGDEAVALKIGPRALVEFESAVLQQLTHPSIVRVRDCVEVGRGAGLVLEYLPGGDLVSLAGAAPEHWQQAVDGVIDALEAIHARGWVHRDIKARNVMFDAADRARLIDFGSACQIGSVWTRAGTTTVAPERGQAPVAIADDLYALAALVFELVQGAPPGPRRLGLERPDLGELASCVDAMLDNPNAHAKQDLTHLRAVIKSLP